MQAILTVLGRRSREFEKEADQRLDLHGCDLRGVRLIGAQFERTNFQKSHLEHANLCRAHLGGADFTYAHLGKAYLREAELKGAYFWKSDVDETDFLWADMGGRG